VKVEGNTKLSVEHATEGMRSRSAVAKLGLGVVGSLRKGLHLWDLASYLHGLSQPEDSASEHGGQPEPVPLPAFLQKGYITSEGPADVAGRRLRMAKDKG
jgi:hypothetical protein